MKRLRTGFTTGTYAAATVLAAWRCLQGRRNGARIAVRFPDGRTRRVNMEGWSRSGGTATAWARKDAGDDIDITRGAVIRTHLRKIKQADTLPADHLEPCRCATLVIRGGDGVGLCSRLGLDVPPGKWAINPTPRRMIVDNLATAGFGADDGLWLVEVSIENGEQLARKTLNPTLGISGGLSILGTSGIVVPCSHAAYIKTIQILLKGAARSGCRTAVLVTGGRTYRAARAAYPQLPEMAFVRIGDFIQAACQEVARQGFTQLIVCCMAGKLAKYALGHPYTHAHRVALSVPDVIALLQANGLPRADVPPACHAAVTVRECLTLLNDDTRRAALDILTERARAVIAQWAGGLSVTIHLQASGDSP
jgi:cobalt-precorrin-5B (C1)-methyltransferase